MVLLAPDGTGRELTGDSAALAREVLAVLQSPRTGADVVAHLEALTGAPLPRPAVVGELLALLRHSGAVVPAGAAAPSARPRRPPGRARVVLGLTGAVATMHAPGMVQRLQARGFTVRVAATESALHFVSTEALEALTHHPVVGLMWPEPPEPLEAGAPEPAPSVRVPHIELAQWADAVLVSPASATTIARLATGDHGSVVAAVALATRAPVVVVPSMNPAMLESPAVARNVAQLATDGMHVVHPALGLEVADRPEARTPLPGAAPPAAVVVEILEAILRSHGPRPAVVPTDAAGWDALYRERAPAELGWHTDAVDDDLAAAVDRLAPDRASVLEVGAGLGTVAAELARRGHRVVATDISAVALEAARTRFADAPVVWVQDDVTDSRIRGTFDLVVDRACLHLLDGPGARRWAEAIPPPARPRGNPAGQGPGRGRGRDPLGDRLDRRGPARPARPRLRPARFDPDHPARAGRGPGRGPARAAPRRLTPRLKPARGSAAIEPRGRPAPPRAAPARRTRSPPARPRCCSGPGGSRCPRPQTPG